MSFESAVFALLAAGSPFPTGDEGRVYPVVAPEGVEPPFITYERMSTDAVWTLTGQANLDAVVVDVVCHARTLAEARSVADQVRSSFAADVALRMKLEDDEVDFDFDRKLYLVVQTWRGWDKRS